MSRPSDHAAELRCAGCSRADRYAAAVMLDLFDKVYEALPPCEHCGGERMQRLASAILNAEAKLAEPCSCAATDHPGLQPFAEWCKELAALWTAAHSLSPGTRIQAALDAARQVRAR